MKVLEIVVLGFVSVLVILLVLRPMMSRLNEYQGLDAEGDPIGVDIFPR